jgi:type I protein arginine methyltransferase
MARSEKYTVNFQTAHETDLHNIEIPLSFVVHQAGTVHGLAFWFDVAFFGSQ